MDIKEDVLRMAMGKSGTSRRVLWKGLEENRKQQDKHV